MRATDEARAEERERCAMVAEALADHLQVKLRQQRIVSLADSRIAAELACRIDTARDIAAEIRKNR